MGDKLTEIARNELPRLKELYTLDGTFKKYLSYRVIDNYIKWFAQDSNLHDIKFFCLNGDFTKGTFVVVDSNVVHAATLSEANDELVQLLFLCDFSSKVWFNNLNERDESAARKVIASKKLCIDVDTTFLLYYLPKEKALELDVSPLEGVELRPLTNSADIRKSFDVWPGCKRTSVQFFERVAKYDISCGAYLSDGTLVAWAYRFPTGPIMALQTDEKYYGRGYGSLVAKAISKQIASIGHDVYAGILANNTASRALFGKLGFKDIEQLTTITADVCSTDQ